MAKGNVVILNIPGWKNSGEGHWQTIWEAKDPHVFKRIEQRNWIFPERNAWIIEIKKAIENYPNKEIFITAHSIGCVAFVHAVKAFQLNVKGAMLVAPSDPEKEGYPVEISGFNPVPLIPLPFPSVVIASTDDQAVSFLRAESFAKHWGSAFVLLENAGHIDQKSGFGEWKEGQEMLTQQIRDLNY